MTLTPHYIYVLFAYVKSLIAGQSEVSPGTELVIIQKVPSNLMPTPQNKLVPIEAAYSDDEGEVALVKENKQASHLLCVVGPSPSCSVTSMQTVNASPTPALLMLQSLTCCTNVQFLMSRIKQQHLTADFDNVLHVTDLMRMPQGLACTSWQSCH